MAQRDQAIESIDAAQSTDWDTEPGAMYAIACLLQAITHAILSLKEE